MEIMIKVIRMMALVLMVVGASMQVSAQEPAKMEQVAFTVSPKMNCKNCENRVKNGLLSMDGVTAVATCLKSQAVTVTFDPAKADKAKIAEALGKLGYTGTECAVKAHAGCKGDKAQCEEEVKHGDEHCGHCDGNHKH